MLLSLQLPFAVWPLVYFTSRRDKLGMWANGWPLTVVLVLVALGITLLNLLLFASFVRAALE